MNYKVGLIDKLIKKKHHKGNIFYLEVENDKKYH